MTHERFLKIPTKLLYTKEFNKFIMTDCLFSGINSYKEFLYFLDIIYTLQFCDFRKKYLDNKINIEINLSKFDYGYVKSKKLKDHQALSTITKVLKKIDNIGGYFGLNRENYNKDLINIVSFKKFILQIEIDYNLLMAIQNFRYKSGKGFTNLDIDKIISVSDLEVKQKLFWIKTAVLKEHFKGYKKAGDIGIEIEELKKYYNTKNETTLYNTLTSLGKFFNIKKVFKMIRFDFIEVVAYQVEKLTKNVINKIRAVQKITQIKFLDKNNNIIIMKNRVKKLLANLKNMVIDKSTEIYLRSVYEKYQH